MEKEILALRNYAHIGDTVWELFVRNYTIYKTSNSKLLHKLTTDRVNAYFQKEMLDVILPELTDDEAECVVTALNPIQVQEEVEPEETLEVVKPRKVIKQAREENHRSGGLF